MHLQNVHHLALYSIANVVVAEVDVLPPLVVEILLSAVGSSSVVDVRELLGNHLFEEVEDEIGRASCRERV